MQVCSRAWQQARYKKSCWPLYNLVEENEHAAATMICLPSSAMERKVKWPNKIQDQQHTQTNSPGTLWDGFPIYELSLVCILLLKSNSKLLLVFLLYRSHILSCEDIDTTKQTIAKLLLMFEQRRTSTAQKSQVQLNHQYRWSIHFLSTPSNFSHRPRKLGSACNSLVKQTKVNYDIR